MTDAVDLAFQAICDQFPELHRETLQIIYDQLELVYVAGATDVDIPTLKKLQTPTLAAAMGRSKQ